MEYKQDEHMIYPKLPSAPEDPKDGHSYRLQKINDIQRSLEDERSKRESLSKKYHRCVKVINGIDTMLITSTMGLGIAGVGLLSTIIAAPAVLSLEGAALVSGFLSIIAKYANKKFNLKAEKHQKIQVLAEAKLNTISDHISKALIDEHVSDEEFTLILSELNKFLEMKDGIRNKTKRVIDEETKQSLINQGREEARESIRRYFQKGDENRVEN